MDKTLYIGIDLGSSNIKTVLFNNDFEVLASETREIDLIIPNPGWTEYDPDDWWKRVSDSLKEILSRPGIDRKYIAGIGVSSLGCCAVPLDKDGNHVYNAIPWSDQRTDKEVQFLKDNCQDMIYEVSGNIPTRLSATPHLMWIKNNKPDAYKKIYKYTEASGYIGVKLTGNFTLDYSTASHLDYGFDFKKMDWNEEIVNAMGLDIKKFPQLHDNLKPIGTVCKKAAKEMDLLEGTPVYMAGLDTVAAALASGVIHSGQGFYAMGSAANMMFMTDSQEKTPFLESFIHITDPDVRILSGSQGAVGFSLKWFRDNFTGEEISTSGKVHKKENTFRKLTLQAEKIEAGSNGLIYLPFLFGKYHPVFSQTVRGTFIGLEPTTSKAGFVRSIMEGCTFNLYENIESAENIGVELNEIITSGGPSKSDLWCQIIADVTNRKVFTTNSTEGSPLGNAFLVSIGEGIHDSFTDIVKKYIKKDKEYNPEPKRNEIYKSLFEVYKQAYDSLVSVYDRLNTVKT